MRIEDTAPTPPVKVLNNDLNLGGPRIFQVVNETQVDMEFGTTEFDVKITYYTNNIIVSTSQYYSISSGTDPIFSGADAVKVEFARSLPHHSMKFKYDTSNPTIGFAIFGTGPVNDGSINYYYYSLLDSSYMLGDAVIPVPTIDGNGNISSTGLLAQIDPNSINPQYNISQPGDVGIMTATFSQFTTGLQIGYQAVNSDHVGFFDYNLELPPNLIAMYAGDWSDNPLLTILGQLDDLGTVNGNFSINVNHKSGEVNPYTLSSQETILANSLIAKGWSLVINGVHRIALETNFPPSTDINPVASFQNNTDVSVNLNIVNNIDVFNSNVTIQSGGYVEYIYRDIDTHTVLSVSSFDGSASRDIICGTTVISTTPGGTTKIGDDITLSSLQYALTNLSPGKVNFTIAYTGNGITTTTSTTTTTTTVASPASPASLVIKPTSIGPISDTSSIIFDTLHYDKVNNLVQTSQGIKVPTLKAKSIIDFVRNIVRMGGSTNCNTNISGYLVTQVTSEFAAVGCHVIKISEMISIGKTIGWDGY